MNSASFLLLLALTSSIAGAALPSPETANAALEEAVYEMSSLAVVRALEAGANPNLQLKVSHSQVKPALQIAAYTGQLEMVRTLLLYGAKPSEIDDVGESLLHRLVGYCRGEETFLPRDFPTLTLDQRISLLEVLVTAGIQDAPTSKRDSTCRYAAGESTRLGMTPLALATKSANLALVQLVLRIPGVQVDARAAGKTPLLHTLTSKTPNLEVVDLLLKAGADVAAKDDAGNTALHLTAAAGAGVDWIRTLLGLGLPLEATNTAGETALTYAIGPQSPLKAVEALLEVGASPVGSAVLKSVKHRRADILKLLLSRGASLKGVAYAALREALSQTAWDVAETLIAAGASVNEPSASGERLLLWALGNGTETAVLPAVSFLLKKGADPHTGHPLIRSAEKGWPLTAQALLQAGAPVNAVEPLGSTGRTAFSVSVAAGRWDLARTLVAAGAQGDLPSPGLCLSYAVNQKSLEGLEVVLSAGANVNPPSSPLLSAIFGKWVEGAYRLLEAGTDPNASIGSTSALALAIEKDLKDLALTLAQHPKLELERAGSDGRTAVHFANTREILGTLLTRGANPNAADHYKGETPLHVFTALGRLDLVKLLIKFRADPNLRDKNGKSPVEVARDRGHIPLVLYLCQSGAKDEYCTP